MHPETSDGFVLVNRTSPFLDMVGPLWFCAGEEGQPPVCGLRIEGRHANGRGTADGRMLMTMADLVLGYTAAFSQEPPVPLTTASMSVDFAGSASVGEWLEGELTCNGSDATSRSSTPTYLWMTSGSCARVQFSPSARALCPHTTRDGTLDQAPGRRPSEDPLRERAIRSMDRTVRRRSRQPCV